MANNLAPLLRQLKAAREKIAIAPVGFIDAAYVDAEVSAVAKDRTVQITITEDGVAKDIVPGLAAEQGDDSNFTSVDLKLEYFRKHTFYLTDEEVRALETNDSDTSFMATKIVRGIKILNAEIERELAKQTRSACRAYGTPGEKLFDVAGDFTDLSFARQILRVNGAPVNPFYGVMDTLITANLMGKQSAATTMIDPRMQRSAIIPQTMGGFLLESAYVPAHDSSGLVGKIVNQANLAVGDTTIIVDGAAGDFNAGDVFTIAGDANQYVVQSYANNVITINKPGLRIAAPDNAAITVLGDHIQNMIVAPETLILLSRLPGSQGAEKDAAAEIFTFQDPATGIPYELRRYPQYRQSSWELATAFGAGMVNTEGCALLIQ